MRGRSPGVRDFYGGVADKQSSVVEKERALTTEREFSFLWLRRGVWPRGGLNLALDLLTY